MDTQEAPIASGVTGLDAEALKVLDGQKLPVNDRVSHWLNGSPPAVNRSGVLSTVVAGKDVNLLQLLHNLIHANRSEILTHPVSSSTCIEPNLLSTTIPAAFTSDPMEFQVQNLKTAYLAAKTRRGSSSDSHLHYTQEDDCTMGRAEGPMLEDELVPTMATQLEPASEHVKAIVCCDMKGSKVDSAAVVCDTTAQELRKERACREKLERELVEERHKRLKLEQEATLAHKTEHQEPKRQKWNRISQSRKAGSAGTEGMECPQKSASFPALTSESMKGGCTSQVVRLPADTSSKLAAHKHQNVSSCHTEWKTAKTPGSSKTNTRYADSSNIFQTPRLPRPYKRASLPQACATPCNHGVKNTKERDTEIEIVMPRSRLLPSQTPNRPSSLLYSRVLGSCTQPSSISAPLCTPQTTKSHVCLPQCDHQCLGCHPRFKCPLITSRNFVKMLRADRFTCAYHRRLVNRLANQMDNLPFAVMRPSQIGKQAGASSTPPTLHTNSKSVSTQTQPHAPIMFSRCPGPHQESPLRMEYSPPPSATQVNVATSFPAPHSLTPDRLRIREESAYSQVAQDLPVPRPTTSLETNRNLPPSNPKHHHYGSASSQLTCQHIKPSGNQRSRISNPTHHRQPKTKVQCSSSHSKKLTKGFSVRSPPLTNVTNVAHRPLSVFDYRITPPDKFKAANTKMPTMLQPSNRHEVSH